MTCSVCGTPNAADASFCTRCGTALKPGAVTGPTVRLGDTNAVPPAQPGASYPPSPHGYVVPQQSVSALVALVLGVVSLLLLVLPGSSLLTAIPAIIVGGKARDEIRASRGQITGEGMAQAGVVLGWVTIGLIVLGFVLMCAAFALFALPFAFIPFGA